MGFNETVIHCPHCYSSSLRSRPGFDERDLRHTGVTDSDPVSLVCPKTCLFVVRNGPFVDCSSGVPPHRSFERLTGVFVVLL